MAKEKPKTELVGFKGFDNALDCIGKYYEVGKTFTVRGKLEMCARGMHFCTRPIDVLTYYGPSRRHRFAVVTAKGKVIRSSDLFSSDPCLTTKAVTNKLEITREITLAQLIRYQNDIACADNQIQENYHSANSNTKVLVVEADDSDDGIIKQCVAVAPKPYSTAYGEICYGSTTVSVALARGSYAHTSFPRGICVACGAYSAAFAAHVCSVAVARSFDTAILCALEHSVGVALDNRTSITLEGSWSTAVANNGCGCYVQLLNNYQVAVVCPGSNVDVVGKHCLIIFTSEPYGSEELELTRGTEIVVPVGTQENNYYIKRKHHRRVLLRVGSSALPIPAGQQHLRTTGASVLVAALRAAKEPKDDHTTAETV